MRAPAQASPSASPSAGPGPEPLLPLLPLLPRLPRLPRQSDAPWPYSASAEWAGAVRRLLAAVQGLPLLGWESALRLAPGQAHADRLLLGLATAGVAPARLAGLPQALAMPADLSPGFRAELPLARRVLLAAERGPRGLEFRAYLEFHEGLHSELLAPRLAMRGRKWLVHGAAPGTRVSDYLRMDLAPERVPGVLRALPTSHPAHAPHAVLAQLAQAALERQGSAWQADFLTVTEAPSARLSCCLRFHGSGLRLADLAPALAPLARRWDLGSVCEQLPGERRLGWLAAGLDGAGLAFLTVYSDARLADARHAIALGARDETD